MPVGLLTRLLGPFRTRSGATSPCAEASNTRIEFPPSLATNSSLRSGSRVSPVGESIMAALNHANRSFISLLHLVVNHQGIVMLNAKEQFLGFLVDRNAKGAVGSMKFPVGNHIADGFAGE